MTKIRLLIAAAGILLPYLARLPGGLAWVEQYTAAGVGGFLFITALGGIALGWMLVWTALIRQPRWWLLPCGLGFGSLAWAHGSLDLSADAQAAIAVVFIPIHALVPITVGGVVGLAMDRLTRLLLFAWLAWAGVMPSMQAAPPPNIVLFLADDLGYGELGCYGNQGAITPNLDRFAAEGVLLTDCHSASSVCSPSRSSLLTGRMPYRNGVFTWIPEGSPIHLRTTERTLPTLLKAAGYETCHVGKWHLNGKFNLDDQPQPDDHGYDWWLATQNNAAPSHAFPENLVRNGRPIGKADDYSAPFVVREAVTWLETRHDRTKPFFLAVWTHEPHYPIASAERYEREHARVADPEERTYRANITQLDDAFGSLMQSLDRLGVRDSTLVFFTSDNGPEGAGDKGPGRGLAGPLRGRKRSMYEGGHRVPGLIRWPGRVEAGSRSERPVIGSDFFPTALRAAGVAVPDDRPIDGVDMFEPVGERTAPMYWRWGGFVAYREGPWKIVADESLATPELYNLATDLAESHDLASREPERCAAMRSRLEMLTAEVEAEGPDWWRGHDFAPKRPRGRADTTRQGKPAATP